MMSAEKSRANVAVALLCGVALCCSIMYLTADGDGVVREELSIESMDVLKAGDIISETPRGRESFMVYFTHIENTIATEISDRKADIASARVQMAKDEAFSSASRARLNRDMMHKMAVNAKIARRHLNRAMRRTQMKMHAYAHLQNRRNVANKRRDAQTLKFARQDKAENEHHLALAVSSWQKATQAFAAKTNAKIDRMNAHAAANAAQIKQNALKARKDLANTMSEWDHKVTNFRTTEKNANDKLSAQFAQQSKATRNWANNKIKGLVARTAAKFDDVETGLAKARHEVDMNLKHAVMRLEATMNKQKALEDSRYSKTVADIAATRAETNSKVNGMKAQFKVALLALSSTVSSQVSKVNNRIDKTAGTVRSNKAAQAKINVNVNAEMTRMIKLGNKNYAAHLKHDTELQALIVKDKAATDKKMNEMAADFNNKLAKIKKELAKARKHAEGELKKKTAGVFAKLYANQDAQRVKNAKLAADTRRMRLDALDNIRKAKADFQAKIHHLAKVVSKNDKKQNKNIEKLTGIVTKNAAKSAKGRQAIQAIENANKDELHKSIQEAIATGEKRAQAVEAKGAKMDKDTKYLINAKLDSEITKLRDETNASVEGLALQSKEARAEMRKEMLYAIRSAADVAKNDLAQAIREGEKRMEAFDKKASSVHAKSALARKALKESVARNAKEVSRMIKDAVATDARAQAALAHETAKAIKKTNRDLTAHATQMKKDAKKVRVAMETQETAVLAQIATESKAAELALKGAKDADAARKKAAMSFLKAELIKAGKASQLKFGKAYETMAKNRGHAENMLGGAVDKLNDSLAKQAALEDTRFSKSVKDIDSARKQAAKQVSDMRKEFATAIFDTTAIAKNVETKLVGLTEKVSGEVVSFKSSQMRVNRRVAEEKKRIEEISNTDFSESKRARGKLRALMDANKLAAQDETKALTKDLEGKLAKMRSKTAEAKREMAKDLTHATEVFYGKLGKFQAATADAMTELNGQTEAAKLEAAAKMKQAEKMFGSKILTLTDIVTADAKKAKRGIERLTGVANDLNKANAAERKLLKDQQKAVQADLNKALDRAISIGEARAKGVMQRINEHQKGVKRFLMVELTEGVERAADKVLKTLEGHRQKIGDNYLSFKAYAVAASDKVEDAVSKGKGKSLSSVGDLLMTVNGLAGVKVPKVEGLGMGGKSIPAIFSGEKVVVGNAVNLINGLNDEYIKCVSQVRDRWPLGLGKYLLDKVELSMADKGILQVDKVAGKPGNFVYINGRSVGLSNKLDSFEQLAARMTTYETVLASLTAKLNAKPAKAAPAKKAFFVSMKQEWQGK